MKNIQSWVETTVPPGYALHIPGAAPEAVPWWRYGWCVGAIRSEAVEWASKPCNTREEACRAAWRHWTATVLRGRTVEWCGPDLDFRSSPVCSERWENDLQARRVGRAASCGEANAATVIRPDAPTFVVGACKDFDLEQIEADGMGGLSVRPWNVWEFPSEYQRDDIDEAMARFAMIVLATEGPVTP